MFCTVEDAEGYNNAQETILTLKFSEEASLV